MLCTYGPRFDRQKTPRLGWNEIENDGTYSRVRRWKLHQGLLTYLTVLTSKTALANAYATSVEIRLISNLDLPRCRLSAMRVRPGHTPGRDLGAECIPYWGRKWLMGRKSRSGLRADH